MKGPSDIVESVRFSFYTDEEIKKISVKKISKPDLLDAKDSPIPDGLYDPALGPINSTDVCKTCGQISVRCVGHCGHIELAMPIYHPLLFKALKDLLHITCFYCYSFKLPKEKLVNYASQLDLIVKGDIAGARNMDPRASPYLISTEESTMQVLDDGTDAIVKPWLNEKWTALQNSEAASVLSKIMKEMVKSCKNCGRKGPKITVPIFGWLNTSVTGSDVRKNAIKDSHLNHPLTNGDIPIIPLGEDSLKGDGATVTDDEGSIPFAKKTESVRGNKSKKLEDLPQELIKQMHSLGPTHLLPSEVLRFLEKLWERETRLCKYLCQVHSNNSSQPGKERFCATFILKSILVPPSRFRPPAASATGGVLEHPQNALLFKVQEANIALRKSISATSSHADYVRSWMDLQKSVNALYDSRKADGKNMKDNTGIRQLLDKKGGILRQKIMGKRVNHAARSVISPDPYLAVNEIGIPPFIALRLTYPERVTPWNVMDLRGAVINGADVHPGATHYEDKDRLYKLQSSKSARNAISRKLPTSRVSTQPRNGPESEFEGKIVYRHLRDGDPVIVNRQPTLHKPSMMVHIARVLKGEKTIRMHYANCSTYNADFDGDEMNIHLPQDEISRAEAIHIVNANKQYIVPTSGDPIRVLIQDHIVSAVLLTKKDTFLTREEYNQLLYASCVPASVNSQTGKLCPKISRLYSEDEIQPLPPAIWKPIPLWTGKQVISAILYHLLKNREPFTIEKDGKVPKEYFGGDLTELRLSIHNNDLIHGMIDKNQFGKYGLIHVVHELYGSDVAGTLLSSFSRLFTVYLQMHGFTCGVDDLLIDQRADMERKRILGKSEEVSKEAHTKVVSSENCEDLMVLHRKIEKFLRSNGGLATARLDSAVSSAMNSITSKANEALFPRGLVKPFMSNCLSLMTSTGAKGGLVNTTQISSLLGQQELEGKRVPRMVSGKTLPCFSPWDTSPRAGGFISDRFLTGLRLQEFYFHCMAGREGLVDTAIKTSRSGYLQRCLVKNLECLKVCYDLTVRDADGSIIQFAYGEDGVDVLKNSFLTEFDVLAANKDVFLERLNSYIEIGQTSKLHGFINELPHELKKRATDYVDGLKKSKKEHPRRIRTKELLSLLKLKYLSSLADPGEPVGVIAAQSVGEPSTQMTLNTFHLAGRGEMNVTLGMPRLQEILLLAKQNIRTPIVTCPFRDSVSEKEANRLANRLRRISVADIIESMEVCSVPLAIRGHEMVSLFKLKIWLQLHSLYSEELTISAETVEEILKDRFALVLEKDLKKHLETVRKITQITDVSVVRKNDSQEGMEGSEAELESKKGKDDDMDGESDDEGVDLGTDHEKRKRQGNDEMDYEDDFEKEKTMVDDEDGDRTSGFESGIDQLDDDEDNDAEAKKESNFDSNEGETENPDELGTSSDNVTKEQKTKKKINKNIETSKTGRVVYSELEGTVLEVHIVFKNEPHILLAEVAQKAAKKVFLNETKNLELCTVIPPDKTTKSLRLQSAGVNFEAFWDLEKYLDVNNLLSNDIHTVLNTYGVEAARATIINEVRNVFDAYGICVNIRHLSLIADFMTAQGGYRAMNRRMMGAYNASPFTKMSYETAMDFIVQAAQYGEVDTLESPSASACLGQPMKMGTGCFDLLQKLQL